MMSTLMGEVKVIPDTTLDALFLNLVNHYPQKKILEYGDLTMTVSDLDQRSSKLAEYLQDTKHVAKGDVVALLLPRSFDMVISIVAILKCGAAYLPLDTNTPLDRIRFILDDCKPKAVIGQVPDDLLEIDIVALDQIQPRLDMLSGLFQRPNIDASALAYVIYTSGSTGKPKGVMIEHHSVVNRLQWMWETFGFSMDDVILQKTPYVFDVSIWEIFLPLCFGAKMVLCNRDDVGDPSAVIRLLIKHHVTSIHFVPGMYNLFLSHAESSPRGQWNLRQVFCSGEALSPKTAERHHSLFNIPLFNLYGPTEATVDVTAYRITGREKGNVPIGKPVWNTALYILDDSFNAIEKGKIGDLYIGGKQLARRYVDFNLGQDRFIIHPLFGRLYKTGDQASVNSEDEIEFHGRNDFQIKIRGFRVELGEIESAMMEHSLLDFAVVEARQDIIRGQTLVAYYKTKTEEGPSEDQIIDFLSRWLPQYMIPTQFILVDVFPLTINGKIDRKKLTERYTPDEKLNENELSTATELEQRISSIWVSVLNIPEIGIGQNFFRLGGDSLTAIKLMNAINSELSLSLPMKTIFNHPTIRAITKVVEQVDVSSNVLVP